MYCSQSKMGCGCGSRGRVPVLQAWSSKWVQTQCQLFNLKRNSVLVYGFISRLTVATISPPDHKFAVLHESIISGMI
jgi:hypothetical protein